MRASAIVFAALSCVAARSAVIDRIAVTVGKQVIAESEVILELRLAAFLDQKPLTLTGEEKRKAADRLVEQTLIRQEAEASRLVLSTQEDLPKLLAPVKEQFGGDANYQAALTRYQISEQDLVEHLLAGLRNLRFTDLRFRPAVQIADDELREYYNMLATEWRQKNPAQVPTFDESRSQVEELLTQDRATQALDRWLGTARTETQILYHEDVFR